VRIYVITYSIIC